MVLFSPNIWFDKSDEKVAVLEMKERLLNVYAMIS